jgi:Divergent InlB B-repeat domain
MARLALSSSWFFKGCAAFLFCVLAGLNAPAAHATIAYSDGGVQFQEEDCGGPFIASEAVAGFQTDASIQFPSVGSIGYVHAVVANEGCLDDTAGFFFNLPPGASFAISTVNPVVCLIGENGSLVAQQVQNTSTSGCSQTPTLDPNGKGYFFGYSRIYSATPGQYLEIRVPVKYSQQLNASSANLLAVYVSTANCLAGQNCLMEAVQEVTVYASSSAPQTHLLTVTKYGSGTVTSSPAGIACGTTCSASFAANSHVILTAQPANGYEFAGWSGGLCSGTSTTCSVFVIQAENVTATFSPLPGTLNIQVQGLPSGAVAQVTATGPSGSYTASLTDALGVSFSDVPSGTYVVSGAPSSLPRTLVYDAPSQTVTVTPQPVPRQGVIILGNGATTVTLQYAPAVIILPIRIR